MIFISEATNNLNMQFANLHGLERFLIDNNQQSVNLSEEQAASKRG